MTVVVTHPDTRLHHPGGEVWLGMRTPGTEVPGRVDVIEQAIRAAGHPVVEARPHADDSLLAVHDEALVAYLSSAWERWDEAGLPEREGADRVVPYLFPTEGLLQGLPAREAVAPHARAGVFCYDTMTLIGPGTWPAVRAGADCALTAVDLVAEGAGAAYALCRPPGHHATRSAFGGSCYLNNAAIAAQALRDRRFARVAVLDVDAHHGNGTQSIFYDRADVVTASLHVDPGAGWFPHHVGFAEEVGRGAGEGSNRNLPLAEGTGDDEWVTALKHLADWVAGSAPDALVVSLGVDAAADDPESPLRVEEAGFRRAGEIVSGLGLPTVVVQEGGYHLPTLGALVAAFLDSLAIDGSPRRR